MFGTLVNTLAILAGSLIGLLFRGGIPDRINETVMRAIGLAVVLIGLQGALKTEAILLLVFSLAIGRVLGEWLNIEQRLDSLGQWIGRRMKGAGGTVSQGFVTASLVYCVGAMAIVGSLESGLTGNHQTLFAKSVLDGISAIIFASTLGIGVMFSAVSVLVYQGIITLSAASVNRFLHPEVISQMSAVGGLLIAAIGFNLLQFKRIKVGNMLPAIFIPLAYSLIRGLLAMG